jgi:hypothetical protein
MCNPLLLYYAARSPHFATSVCFTNVASVERIYLRDFQSFRRTPAAPHAHDFLHQQLDVTTLVTYQRSYLHRPVK